MQTLGVLQALDALADLALEHSFFDCQPDLNKLVDDGAELTYLSPMGNLYSVIIFWLSKEVCVDKI